MNKGGVKRKLPAVPSAKVENSGIPRPSGKEGGSPSESHNQSDLGKISIGKLVSLLSVRQLWGVLGALVGLLVASFTAGYKLSSKLDQATIRMKDAEVAVLQEREKFLSLYINCQLLEKKAPLDKEEKEELARTRRELDILAGKYIGYEP